MTVGQRTHRPARLRRALAHGRALAGTGLLVTAFGLAALMFLPPLFGYQRYVIDGGSMTGSIDRGSIVYDKAVPVAGLHVGDVITYAPPGGALLTHRIVWAGRDGHGRLAFRTKGDANKAADPWRFTLTRPTQARVAFHIPYVGYAFAALAIRWLRMLIIGLPALLIAIAAIAGLRREWREATPA